MFPAPWKLFARNEQGSGSGVFEDGGDLRVEMDQNAFEQAADDLADGEGRGQVADGIEAGARPIPSS